MFRLLVRENCQKLRGQVFSLIANPNICQLQSILNRTDGVILCSMQRKDGQNNQSITPARITLTKNWHYCQKQIGPAPFLSRNIFFLIWPLSVVLLRKWTKPLLPSLSAHKYAVERALYKELNNTFTKVGFQKGEMSSRSMPKNF